MKKIIVLILLSLILVQCNNQNDTLIAKNQVGKLSKSTKISDLDDIFKNDSVIRIPEDTDNFYEYRVFQKGGKQLLTIKPKFERDTIKLIESVQIFSNRFKTVKGISTLSVYKDIVDNYSINKIEPTFTSAIVIIDELNATFALDKNDLRLNEFDMNKINKDQVPDMAKIKYITVWFD